MNSILDKFNTIEIKQTDKITAEDRQYCQLHENIYYKAHRAYADMLQQLKEINELQKQETKQAQEIGLLGDYSDSTLDYVSEYLDGGIRDIEKALSKTTSKFISSIMYHFIKKYNVDLDIYKPCDIYDNDYRKESAKTLLTINDVLERCIFPQLDGCTFQELAIKQIKEKAKCPLFWNSYRQYWNYEVKGKFIKFTFDIDNSIQPALYYYDNNEKAIIDCYTHNKIDDYTHYDNGNTNIKFYNAADALDFAKRYLGYVEMTKEQREEYKKKCNRW